MHRSRTVLALVAVGLAVPSAAQAARLPLLTPIRYIHALEGQRARVVVRLSAPAGRAVTMRFSTRSGSATAGADFRSTRGTLRIRRGARRGRILVKTLHDFNDEPTETFRVRLRALRGVRRGSVRSIPVSIIDANPARATVTTHAIQEPARTGQSVPMGAVVTIRGASAGAKPVTLAYEIVGVEPTVDAHDATLGAGTLRFAAGETRKVIPGVVKGDAVDEGEEHLLILLSSTRGVYVPAGEPIVTITDDPGDAPPAVSIGDITASEGAGGAVQVPLTLSAPSERTVQVTYTTAPGSADIHDFVSTTGTVTFAPDSTAAAAPVALIDDLIDEPDQAFSVTLSDPVDVTIAGAQATVTIVDDDPPPSVSIGDGSVSEPGTAASLPIWLSRVSEKTVTVHPAITGGTATVGAACDDNPMTEDPVDVIAPAPGLVITIPPGSTSASFDIATCDDSFPENNETVLYTLSDPVNALLGDDTGQLTVFDDDEGNP